MLLNSIENIINKIVNEYNSKLVEKYNLDSTDLQELWKDISGTNSKKNKSETSSVKSEKSVKSKKKIEGGCPYVFIKGKDEGTTCGSKPKSGGTYCGKHQKCEGVGQAEKKKTPLGKKTISEASEQKDKEPIKKKVQIVIRLNKQLDKYWNPETSLVFKSKEDRVVIGSYRDEKFETLIPDDIVICEKYGFKYETEKSTDKKADKSKDKKANKQKNLSDEIVKTNLQAEHIENVLAEICKNSDNEDDEEVNDEEVGHPDPDEDEDSFEEEVEDLEEEVEDDD